ncbi:putative Ribonuclease P protein subunit p29 [Hypsibius exemplaris]|uniref:Ribonuclease P protein subunit p29 n=1 Tax=Hypsibius exemplaris TaxID=2072580 RepID=A0A9X6NFF3_HYPEX|nr:putative Ribonuclease P protein subunit p29 [Hypsibius exemplaris]
MDLSENNLYDTIEEVTQKTSQELNLLGQGGGNKSLRHLLHKGFVTDKKRFDESFRKNYLLLATKRKAKKAKKEKPLKGLSNKERKRLKIYDIPKEQQKFDLVKPLHDLWCGYMEQTFNLSGMTPARVAVTQDDLTKADYHGALLKVMESPNASLIGLEGIVVRETRNMFHVITRQDKLKILQKSVCIFMCTCGGTKIKIFGNNFCARPADRIKKKMGKRLPIRML